MVANSTDGRAWLGWLTPFGWLDHLAPFGDPQPVALVVLSRAGAAHGRRRAVGTAATPAERCWGSATAGGRGSRARRPGPLRLADQPAGPDRLGPGPGGYAFVLGALVTTMIDFLARRCELPADPGRPGLDVALTVDGFVGVMSVTLGVGFALYAAWRIGAVRSEEESGRADNLLTRPHQVALAARPCRAPRCSAPPCWSSHRARHVGGRRGVRIGPADAWRVAPGSPEHRVRRRPRDRSRPSPRSASCAPDRRGPRGVTGAVTC